MLPHKSKQQLRDILILLKNVKLQKSNMLSIQTEIGLNNGNYKNKYAKYSKWNNMDQKYIYKKLYSLYKPSFLQNIQFIRIQHISEQSDLHEDYF